MFRLPTRRTFLQAATMTGTLLPASVLAQRAFVHGPSVDPFDPAICQASCGAAISWSATIDGMPFRPA